MLPRRGATLVYRARNGTGPPAGAFRKIRFRRHPGCRFRAAYSPQCARLFGGSPADACLGNRGHDGNIQRGQRRAASSAPLRGSGAARDGFPDRGTLRFYSLHRLVSRLCRLAGSIHKLPGPRGLFQRDTKLQRRVRSRTMERLGCDGKPHAPAWRKRMAGPDGSGRRRSARCGTGHPPQPPQLAIPVRR